MTTIAADARAGVMCADSQWTDGDECGPMRKVWRVRGALYGCAGRFKPIQAWLEALRVDKPLPRVQELTVLRLQRGGLAVWDGTNGWVECGSTFAIGSGGKAARGALAAGASCARAVRIARDIDAETRGQVRTYRL